MASASASASDHTPQLDGGGAKHSTTSATYVAPHPPSTIDDSTTTSTESPHFDGASVDDNDNDDNVTSSLSSRSSSSSSVDSASIDASAQRSVWKQREQQASTPLSNNRHHRSSSSTSRPQQRHRRDQSLLLSSSSTMAAAAAAATSPSTPLDMTTALQTIDAETLQRLLILAQQQQQQHILNAQQQNLAFGDAHLRRGHSVPTAEPASAPSTAPLSTPSSSTRHLSDSSSQTNGSHHHHHHQHQQQRQQSGRSRALTTIASLFAALAVAVLAWGGYVLYARMSAATPPPVSSVAWRMAQVLESDFCIPVSVDEVRTGRTHDGVDLKALRQTMFVHLNAGGLRGICAQHLEGAAPVCQCLLRLSDPAVDGKLSQAKNSDLIDLYNLNIEHVSEKAVPVRERHVFCGNGENRYWIMRHRTCLARYMGEDGEYHRGHFNGSQSAVVQSMWELHMGYSFCLIDGNMVMLKKLRDSHLYGKGIDQQWNDRRRLAAHADGGPSRISGLLAPDSSPIYRGISPTDTWTSNMRTVGQGQQHQQ